MSLYVNAETMVSVKQAQSLAIAATLKFPCSEKKAHFLFK